MTIAEIVVNPDVVAARQEQTHGMTADVAGAAGDENSHKLGCRLRRSKGCYAASGVKVSVGNSLGNAHEHIFEVDFFLAQQLDAEVVPHQQFGNEAAVGHLIVE